LICNFYAIRVDLESYRRIAIELSSLSSCATRCTSNSGGAANTNIPGFSAQGSPDHLLVVTTKYYHDSATNDEAYLGSCLLLRATTAVIF